MPMPRELVAKDSVIFIHRMISDKKPEQLYALLRFPSRNTWATVPQLKDRPMTERSRRASFNIMVKTYARIDQSTRGLSNTAFKSIVGRYDYSILPEDEQRN